MNPMGISTPEAKQGRRSSALKIDNFDGKKFNELDIHSTAEGLPLPSALGSTLKRMSIMQVGAMPMKDEFKIEPDASTKIEPSLNWEWWGWFFYEFGDAAFFYSVCNFLPLLITWQAADYAKLNACGPTISYQACLPNTTDAYSSCVSKPWAIDFNHTGVCSVTSSMSCTDCLIQNGTWTETWIKEAVFVPFMGGQYAYSGIVPAITAISTVFQVIAFLTFGGQADYGDLRRLFLGLSTAGGVVCCFAVYFCSDPSSYGILAWLYCFSNVFFNLACVYYNAYLPLLCWAHPDVKAASEDPHLKDGDVVEVLKTVNAEKSSKALALGFTGVFVVLALNLGIFLFFPDPLNPSSGTHKNIALRLNILFDGFWCIIFCGLSVFLLHARPAKPLDSGYGPGFGQKLFDYSTIGWRRTFSTIKSIRKLPQFGLYVMAFLIFSDAQSTLSTQAAQFASVELHLSAEYIEFAIIAMAICAIFSCFIWVLIHNKCHLSAKNIIRITLTVMMLLPIWAFFGVTNMMQFFMIAITFGLVTGAYQSFNRGLYARMIPVSHEAEFFSFYQITDKGTAWMGPTTMSAIINNNIQLGGHSVFRTAFLSLSAYFLIGILLFTPYNEEKAMEEKAIYEKAELEENKKSKTGKSYL